MAAEILALADEHSRGDAAVRSIGNGGGKDWPGCGSVASLQLYHYQGPHITQIQVSLETGKCKFSCDLVHIYVQYPS